MTDIVCDKCGRHFNIAEDARAHRGRCTGTVGLTSYSGNPEKKQSVSNEERDRLVAMMNRIQESNVSSATGNEYPDHDRRQPLKSDTKSRQHENSWRWASMKVTVVVVAGLFFVLAFAGVKPFEDYKNTLFGWFKANGEQAATVNPGTNFAQTAFDGRTGVCENWYLGLVKTPEGVMTGHDGYGEFIVLVSNREAKNPTYDELLAFLKQDTTDSLPYSYTPFVGRFYSGTAEDRIDLYRVQQIVEGDLQPNPPQVCVDFAERLHNNAEMAGIRCGYVSLDVAGYDDPENSGIASDAGHALNVFETTDNGIIYIDCTGYANTTGPDYKDRVVDVQIGKDYNPDFLFPSGGWHIPKGEMGVVTAMFTTWDGEWR